MVSQNKQFANRGEEDGTNDALWEDSDEDDMYLLEGESSDEESAAA